MEGILIKNTHKNLQRSNRSNSRLNDKNVGTHPLNSLCMQVLARRQAMKLRFGPAKII